MKVAWIEVLRYELPLVRPLVLPRHTLHQREGLLLVLATGHGEFGYGDIAPLPGFSQETLALAEHQLFDFIEVLKGQSVQVDPIDLLGGASGWHAVAPSVRAGVSMALTGLQARVARQPQATQLNARARHTAQVNALLTGDSAAGVEQARQAAAAGVRCVKVKVGRAAREEELEALHSLRLILGEQVQFRLDANRAWTLDEAVVFGQGLGDLPLDYIEEPLRRPEELPEWHLATGLPFALDETAAPVLSRYYDITHERLDPARYSAGGHVDRKTFEALLRLARAVVVKPTLAGEYARLPHLARHLPGYDGDVVVSSAFESDVGVAALAHLAAAVNDRDVAAGLDTLAWLEDRLLTTLPQHGPELDLAALDAALARIDTTALPVVARA